MIGHNATLSTGPNRQRTETTVDLSNSTTGERPETAPPTYDELNLLPTYGDACNLASMVPQNESVGTTLTSQATRTSGETHLNVFGPFVNGQLFDYGQLPNSSTTSQHRVSPSSASHPTFQDSRTSTNNGVSNAAMTNNCGQISEGERAETVSNEGVNHSCIVTMFKYGCSAALFVLFVVLLFLYVPDKSTTSNSDATGMGLSKEEIQEAQSQRIVKQMWKDEERRRREFRNKVKKGAAEHLLCLMLKKINKTEGIQRATANSDQQQLCKCNYVTATKELCELV